MFVVDTNILLYAADRDAPEHAVCRDLLLTWREQTSPWHLTWGIVYEFLRVSTHRNVFRKPFISHQAWGFIQAVLASPSLSLLVETDRHETVATDVFAGVPGVGIIGNFVFDAHTAILMKEHGIATIFTRDREFRRFSFLQVIDPLQELPDNRHSRAEEST